MENENLIQFTLDRVNFIFRLKEREDILQQCEIYNIIC